MKKIMQSLLILMIITLNGTSFCAQAAKKVTGQAAATKPKLLGAKRINVTGTQTSSAAATAPKTVRTSRAAGGAQYKAAVDAKAAAASVANKQAEAKKVTVDKKYMIENYDPTKAIADETYDKLEALNNYTETTISAKVNAYFKAHQKEKKDYVIKQVVHGFESHLKTYKKHYLKIDKSYGSGNKKPADAIRAFNDVLGTTQGKLEDEHTSCCF
jgi:hypothetical protein